MYVIVYSDTTENWDGKIGLQVMSRDLVMFIAINKDTHKPFIFQPTVELSSNKPLLWQNTHAKKLLFLFIQIRILQM